MMLIKVINKFSVLFVVLIMIIPEGVLDLKSYFQLW